MSNHPVPAASLTPDQQAVLSTWARSRTLSQRRVQRARIMLLAATGVANSRIAKELSCSLPTVQLWRRRFRELGVPGLEQDAPGRGRPRIYDERKVAEILRVTLGKPPRGETYWAAPAVAQRVGTSPSTVLRVWRDQKIQPFRTREAVAEGRSGRREVDGESEIRPFPVPGAAKRRDVTSDRSRDPLRQLW
ncbi:MAG: helix-turn-helix domain-containing protein [Candidatus Dormibacteria bacterium]